MHGLAPFVGLDEENAFLIGLLHDIGNVIVLRQVCTGRAITRFDIDLDTFEYLCHECHQEFGELIAEAWRLPPRLASLIAGHHDYPADDDPLRTERLALRLADMIAAMLGYATPVAYDLLESRVVHDLDLAGRSGFVDLLARLPANLAELVVDSAA